MTVSPGDVRMRVGTFGSSFACVSPAQRNPAARDGQLYVLTSNTNLEIARLDVYRVPAPPLPPPPPPSMPPPEYSLAR